MSNEECNGCDYLDGDRCTSSSLKTCILRRTFEKICKDDEVKICYVTEEEERQLRKLNEQFHAMGMLPSYLVTKSYDVALAKALNVVILPESARELEANETEPREPTIPEIKKRLKHCRNHMERIALEKQLNKAYRDKKKHRRNVDVK